MTDSTNKTSEANSNDGLKTATQGSSDNPRAFLSYAWTDPVHIERIRQLVDRLISNGVDVISDIYDAKLGNDLNYFMESVTDPSVGTVLVIADKKYAEKADSREGGVGTETQLISAEVYKEVKQEKVVALVFEKSESGKAYLPKYMKTRRFVDFTDESQYEEKFDELIRHIYGKPKYEKPPLGPRPNFDSELMHPAEKIPSTGHTEPLTLNTAIDDFVKGLHDLRTIDTTESEIDERVLNGIKRMQPRLISLLGQIDTQLEQGKTSDKDLINKFDQLLTRSKAEEGPLPGVHSYQEWDYEHIGFLIHELTMSIIALLVKHRRFSAIYLLINHTYFYYNHYGELKTGLISIFYKYMHSLDERRNSRLELKRVSVAADTHKENAAKFAVIDFEQLKAADSLLSLLTRFLFPKDHYDWWFPKLSIYSRFSRELVPPMAEMISRSRASEISTMFGVKDVQDLVDKHKQLVESAAPDIDRSDWNYNIPSIKNMLPENINSMP